LLLPLLNQHVIAPLSLGARILAFHVFLELFLMHYILLGHDISFYLGILFALRLLIPFSVALFVASI
jgi:hypothetical protein